MTSRLHESEVVEGRSPRGARRVERKHNLLPELLILVAVAAHLLVVLGARHFPYHDAINHLARWTLISDEWGGRGATWARVDLRVFPSPYLGVDLLGASLVHLIRPANALRTLTALSVASLPASMYALLRVVAPQQRGWALIGVLFSFGFFTLLGSLAEILGLALSLAWLALWWPRRENASVGHVLLLALACVVLYLVHLTAPLSILVVIWIDYALAVFARVKGTTRWSWALLDSRVRTVVPITLVVGALVVGWIATSSSGPARDPFVWSGWEEKGQDLLAPFYSLSFTQLGVMAGGYAASVIAFLIVNGMPRQRDTFAFSAAAFLALFLVFPSRLGTHTSMLDVRWLLPAYLLPFCVAARPIRRSPTTALLVPFVAALLHAAVIGAKARDFDRKLDDYDVVLAGIPPGTKILPLEADPGRHRRVLPYHFYAMWHTVDRHGRVTGLFAFQNDQGTYENLRALRIVDEMLVRVPDYWAIGGRFDYDWPTINRQYDFILLAGTDPVASSYLASRAREVMRVGEVTLYETLRDAPPSITTSQSMRPAMP